MKFKLNDYHRNTPDKDLLDDLKRVAAQLKTEKLIRDKYNVNGKYHSRTIETRFGSWNKALEKAGLKISKKNDLTEKELFENIEEVWIQLGKQPKEREMIQPLSKFSIGPYRSKYGTFRKALEAFIEYIESKEDKIEETEIEENINVIQEHEIIYKHKTKRNISERLKVHVLMRDGNKCRLCGITVTGENIHFDHIIPWSKGGETVLENIQVLCAKHNLAKGNIEL